MKTIQAVVLFFVVAVSTLRGADFNVTAPNVAQSFYTINGQVNPVLTLTRGVTYTFAINANSLHPFAISRDEFGDLYNDGVTNNDISQGTLTFAVPMNAPDVLYYICSFHFFGNEIQVVDPAPTADFVVTTPDFYYDINGNPNNPTLTLTRGVTYTFGVNADPSHPFAIVQSNETGELYNDGVSNNDISNGTITFAVPTNAPSTLYYICSLHFFGGTINIVDPPLPPVPFVKVVSLSLTSNTVTMRSLGSNGWAAIPEFSSNLLTGSWAPVPNYTNSFSNGTNTTTFNRLEPICGPNVFLRVKNTQN